MSKNLPLIFLGAAVFLIVLISNPVFACTDFQIKTTDGTVIIGRSMEFATPIKSHIILNPRGERQEGGSPDGKEGFTWIVKYGYISIGAFGVENAVVDGMNEEGLSIEGLWLPETQYQGVTEAEAGRAINIGRLGAWILGNFKTVDEVKEAVKKVCVWSSVVPEIKMEPPIHFAVHDAGGKNIAIEFIKGKTNIYDNPIGVMTNSPTFDWHLTNLRNYVNLTCQNAEPIKIEGVNLTPTGNGSGMLGVPGDWTPPSRFVRAAMFVHFADPVKNALEGVNLAAHILNTVDIPHGGIKQKGHESPMKDYTQWIAIKDLTNKIFYFRDYKNLSLRAIDLKKLKFAPGTKIKSIPLESNEYGIVEITDKLL